MGLLLRNILTTDAGGSAASRVGDLASLHQRPEMIGGVAGKAGGVDERQRLFAKGAQRSLELDARELPEPGAVRIAVLV